MLKHGKQIPAKSSFSKFTFWILNITLFQYISSRHFRDWKKLSQSGGGGQYSLRATSSLMKIEFNHSQLSGELVGVTPVILLLKLTLDFKLSQSKSSMSYGPRSLFTLCSAVDSHTSYHGTSNSMYHLFPFYLFGNTQIFCRDKYNY